VTGTSDTDDVQALAGGDRDAFAALFRRHHTFVYNVAFRRTASWAAAEDVTGVVFLELWRQRDRVESLGGSLRPWLAGVAANEARHVWRSRSRLAGAVGRLALVHGSDVAAGREPDPADDLAARIDDERAMAALLDTLDALPEAHREVITLWAWEQLSYDEIAVALDVPVGTVRSRLSRARARLRTLDRSDTVVEEDERPGRTVEGTGAPLLAPLREPSTGTVVEGVDDDTGAHEPGGTPHGPGLPPTSAPSRRRRRLAGVAAAVVVVGAGIAGALAQRDTPDPTVTSEADQVTVPVPPPAEPEPAPAPAPDPSEVPEVGAAPDPAHVARVQEIFAGVAGAHTSGWRWPLRAEDVVCWFPEGPMMTSASEFPLDGAMVGQHLVDECTAGNDWASTQQGEQTSPAVPCAIGDDAPGLHVLLDGRACEDIGPGAHALSDADMANVNRLRAVEVAILAAPQDCATAQEAIVWAEAVVTRNSLDLEVGDAPPDPPGSIVPPGVTPSSMPEEETLVVSDCYLARVDWQQRAVTIDGGLY
jgi:RNA polymerase sigma factor (sigma-70 family)